MKKASSLMGSSPQKIGKGAPGAKSAKAGSAALVSDIGIVKKGSKGSADERANTGKTGNDLQASPGLVIEDSFEKYYNKDLDLEEDQVPVVIYELNESAINFITQEQYEKALILLQKAQTMLDQIQADKIPCDQFIFLLTLHNMAMCYQKLGILEECSICLEACIDHLESDYLQTYFNNPEQPSLRLKMLKYKCKTHMQICALLSQIHKHKEAVYHSNHAIKISHYLLNECKNQCEFYIDQLTKKRPNQTTQNVQEISIISDKRFSLLEKTAVKMLPIIIEMQKKMAIEDFRSYADGGIYITGPIKLAKGGRGGVSPTRRGNVAPPGANAKNPEAKDTYTSGAPGPGFYDCGNSDMKNILGYLNQSEWVYSLNIGNIMQISPLTLQDFLSHTAIQLELSREFVLEKMCFLAVSYFCMGTEYRFLHQLKEKINEQTFERRDSEYWHGKAVEVAISFLPSESPLVSHILMSYEKHHSPSNMVIPENESQDKFVRIVRQSYGIDSCRLQPIIRHHPDGEYRVPKIDQARMNWHRIFKTDEYIKTMRLINKKQLNAQNMNSKQIKDLKKNQAQNNFRSNQNNFTQRIQTNNEDMQKQAVKAYLNDAQHRGDRNQIISLDGEVIDHPERFLQDVSNTDENDDDDDRKQFSDDDDNHNKDQRFLMNKTPSQDMFYKNNIQSQDVLKYSSNGNRSNERQISKGNPKSHSQSMHNEDSKIGDSQAPPAFDKNILQQHRNSADSEFNNKGNRKLRPAQKGIEAKEGNQKGNLQNESPRNENNSSKSLDEIDMPNQANGANKGNTAQGPHRRARSSLGMNRKASAKSRGEQKLPQGQQLTQNPNGKKSSNSQSRGAMLGQLRDKNSSSAMAQLQPRPGASGVNMEDEDMLDDIEMIQNGSTYLNNHQSQPLSVLGADNNLIHHAKPRGGQSHQQMNIPGSKKGGSSNGQQSSAAQGSQSSGGTQKIFKNNPTILNGANGELTSEVTATNGVSGVDGGTSANQQTSQQSQNQSSQQQFMGKRNQLIHTQQTAPATGGRKKQANTINVDELQGSAQPTGNVQPSTATTVMGATGGKLNSQNVRSSSRQQHQQMALNNMQQLGNTQLGQLGTANGSSLGNGPANNGFVAGTANIDQSSKNTINVYQFGSGVNFNLKLAPQGITGAGASNPNMSRKQYEQIQSALNQMNSIESRQNQGQQERHNNSLDDKTNFDQNQSTKVGLNNQIANQPKSMQGLASTGPQSNFNQMIIPSTTSKRSAKLSNSANAGNGPSNSGSSQRRKNSQGASNNNNKFNLTNQYLSQGGSTSGALPNSSQQNMVHAQNEIMNLIKKREKMNNSALAQIESGGSSRKFTNSSSVGANPPVANTSVSKIYTQKHHKTQSGSSVAQGAMQVLDSGTNQPGSGTSKTRRQLSNTDKGLNWQNQNLSGTSEGRVNSSQNNGQPNSAQIHGTRKQSGNGSLGGRKTSLEQKFSHGGFGSNHHRQFSDISQQNLIGYKGIGQNLGITGGKQPSGTDAQGVGLNSKLQLQQPTMSEHASMPIMNTSGHAPRFIANGGGQGPSAVSGQISSSTGPGNEMITQIPSFIQRQQQQNQKFQGGVGSSGSNQQKKAQAYLVNQQHQRR